MTRWTDIMYDLMPASRAKRPARLHDPEITHFAALHT
jgi:hypothetical protein